MGRTSSEYPSPMLNSLRGASFKSCPDMGVIVQMTDPRWPSLREAARRFVKAEGCVLSVPQIHMTEAWTMVQLISEHIPARLHLPSVVEGNIMVANLFQVGGPEPDIGTCWVPNCEWNDFYVQVVDLLEAGYPGCVGCGGPGAEEEWNEFSRRALFSA